MSDTRTFNSFGEPQTYRVTANGTEQLLVEYLARDNLGRLQQKRETIGGQTATYAYTYDAAGRLEDVTKNGLSVATYDYDLNGNRLSRLTPTSLDEGSYDDQDRLTQYGNASYTYSANGELEQKTVGSQVTTYGYDVLGNLRTVTLPDGRLIEYVIDGQNRRIGKKVNGALVQGFLYDDQLRIAAELDGAGTVVARFVYGTRVNVPEYMVKGGTTYRIVTDHLGSPRLVINTSTGAIVQRMDYDEFGTGDAGHKPGVPALRVRGRSVRPRHELRALRRTRL